MIRTLTISALVILTVTVAHCDADDPREFIATEAQLRIDADPDFDGPDPARIEALLADGLSREDAVQIALLGNPRLRAAFAELGVAEADLQQAGVYSNPSIETVVLWPPEGDTEIDVEVAWNIADLWRMPVRKRVARAEADRVMMTVLAELLNTAADARLAWDAAVSVAQIVSETADVLDAARSLLDRLRERFDYGFGSELTIERMTAEVAETELELAMAEAELTVALARMRRVLGMPTEVAVEPVGELPEAPADLPSGDTLTSIAVRERPEVRAADLGSSAAHLDLRLERRSTWQRVEIGPAYKRTTAGSELWGLVLEAELPIFDTNRAQRQRASAELSAAEEGARLARVLVREEVEAALEHLKLATHKERLVRERVIPAREHAHEFAQTHHMQMELSMLPVLETRRELADARRMHVEARRQVAEALVELEFAVGGRLP